MMAKVMGDLSLMGDDKVIVVMEEALKTKAISIVLSVKGSGL